MTTDFDAIALAMAQEKVAESAMQILEMRYDRFLIWNIKLNEKAKQHKQRLGKT